MSPTAGIVRSVRRVIPPVLLVAPWLAGCAGSGANSTPAGEGSELSRAVALMSGSFTSQPQSRRDPEYFDIRLHMAPIWASRSSDRAGRWLYVEQAMAQASDKPYRQRIYHVARAKDGSIRSEVYELPGDPLEYAGAWRTPARFDALSPGSLSKREGCAVVLRSAGEGVWEGSTRGTGCASSLRGAAYATSEVHLDLLGLRTWDRGFDAEGRQVWGAVKGPYEFSRAAPEEAM